MDCRSCSTVPDGTICDPDVTLGDPAGSSYLGTPSPYYVNNGRIVTVIAGTPIEVTAYKLGDKYYGARSNEFGYANYQIMAKPPNNLITLPKGVGEQTEDKTPPPGTAD